MSSRIHCDGCGKTVSFADHHPDSPLVVAGQAVSWLRVCSYDRGDIDPDGDQVITHKVRDFCGMRCLSGYSTAAALIDG